MPKTSYTVEAMPPSLEAAIRLTGSGFGHDLNSTEIIILRKILARSTRSYTAQDTTGDNRAVGFGVFRTYTVAGQGDVLFVTSLMTDRHYTPGVGRAILDAAIASEVPTFLAFNTSSPYMYAAGASRTTELYPRLGDDNGQPIPPDIVELGISFSSAADFPVHHGLYENGPLYTTRPQHRLAESFYNYPGYNYENGDALLCLGRVATST